MPGPRGRRVDGQQQQRAEPRQPVARLVGAAVVGHPPGGQRQVRRSPTSRPRAGCRPPPSTRSPASGPARSRARPSRSCSSRARSRPSARRSACRATIDPASGLLWRDGLRRPAGHARLLQPQRGREQLPELAEGEPQLGVARGQGPAAAAAVRRARGRRTSTTAVVRPVRPLVGCAVRADREVSARPERDAAAARVRPEHAPPELVPAAATPTTRASRPDAAAEPRLSRSGTARQRLTTVAPSPPSPRSPGRAERTSGWSAAAVRTASRRAPVPRPWMIVTEPRPATAASSR